MTASRATRPAAGAGHEGPDWIGLTRSTHERRTAGFGATLSSSPVPVKVASPTLSGSPRRVSNVRFYSPKKEREANLRQAARNSEESGPKGRTAQFSMRQAVQRRPLLLYSEGAYRAEKG
jgi:hypothetical protein